MGCLLSGPGGLTDKKLVYPRVDVGASRRRHLCDSREGMKIYRQSAMVGSVELDP